MCSYILKKNVSVILLCRHVDETSESLKNKPEIIHQCDGTKSGVDIMDKLVDWYSVRRRTNRWHFFNIISPTAFAACIIYDENSSTVKNNTNSCRLFLLYLPIVQNRTVNKQILIKLQSELY